MRERVIVYFIVLSFSARSVFIPSNEYCPESKSVYLIILREKACVGRTVRVSFSSSLLLASRVLDLAR